MYTNHSDGLLQLYKYLILVTLVIFIATCVLPLPVGADTITFIPFRAGCASSSWYFLSFNVCGWISGLGMLNKLGSVALAWMVPCTSDISVCGAGSSLSTTVQTFILYYQAISLIPTWRHLDTQAVTRLS